MSALRIGPMSPKLVGYSHNAPLAILNKAMSLILCVPDFLYLFSVWSVRCTPPVFEVSVLLL